LDRLAGGAGNDVYVLDDLTFIDDQSGWQYDAVIEAQNRGIDKVFITPRGNYNYWLDANVENAEVIGAGNQNLIGNDLDNVLVGNGAYNLIYGLGGDDSLIGGDGYDDLLGDAGNDTYRLFDTTIVNGAFEFDGVGEGAGAGIDTVQVSSTVGRLTYVLGVNVGNAAVTGEANFNLVRRRWRRSVQVQRGWRLACRV
jgi:serralysin